MGYTEFIMPFCVVSLIIYLAFSDIIFILRAKFSAVMKDCLVLALTFFMVLTPLFGGLLACQNKLTVTELIILS